MKILVVGHFNYPSSIGWEFVRILGKKYDADYYDTAAPFFEYYKGITNKIIYRLGLSGVLDEISETLIKKVEQFQPDIIFVLKGMEIQPRALSLLKERGVKLINYNPDHPFIFSGRGSGNANVKKGFMFYDMHISYNKQLCNYIENNYNIPTYWLPFGHAFDYSLWEELKDVEEDKNIAFIGSPDKNRVKLIRLLIKEGFPLVTYGNNWEKYLEPEYTQPSVYKEDFWYTIRKHRIQLNVFRKHNYGSHNMRTFDVPSAGGVLLSPFTEEQQCFFTEGKQAFYYRSDKELIKIVDDIYNMDNNSLNKIRDSAFEISKNYTYENRIKKFQEFLEKASL